MSTFNELIDFTRSTTGTYLDSVVYGDELVTNGDFSNGTANWTPYNATLSASNNTLSIIDNGAWTNAWQAISTVVGKTYTFSATLKRYGGVYAAHLEASSTLNQESSSWEFKKSTTDVEATLTIVFKATATTTYIRMRHDGSGNTVDWNNITVKEVIGGQVSGTPLLRTAAINEPRLEYDASGNPLGLLIEEARTNGMLRSELIGSTSWTNNGVFISQSATTAPDGSNTATSLISTASTQEHFTQQGGTNTSATETLSVYAKPNGFNYLFLRTNLDGAWSTGYASFNVATGELGVVGPSIDSTSITYAGNGWYRCSMTFDNRNGQFAQLHAKSTDTATSSSAGDGVNGLYVWGAQVETGSFPTSYIPTSGSTVTRNKDVVSVPVERFGYNTSQATVIAYGKSFLPSSSTYLWEIGAGSADRNFAKAYNQQSLYVIANSVNTVNLNAGTFTANSYGKLASTLKANSFAASFNGASAVVDNTGAVQLDLPAIAIGQNKSYQETLNGHIKSMQYYPKRLSNEELELLTQPSASPTMNLTFDGQATSTLVEGLHD